MDTGLLGGGALHPAQACDAHKSSEGVGSFTPCQDLSQHGLEGRSAESALLDHQVGERRIVELLHQPRGDEAGVLVGPKDADGAETRSGHRATESGVQQQAAVVARPVSVSAMMLDGLPEDALRLGDQRRPRLPEGNPHDTEVHSGLRGYRVSPDETDNVHLLACPWYHTAPIAMAGPSIHMGHPMVIMDRFDAERCLALIDRYKVTITHLVRTQFVRLLALPDDVKRRYDVSSIRHAIHGAAPIAPDIKRRMLEWWGPVHRGVLRFD